MVSKIIPPEWLITDRGNDGLDRNLQLLFMNLQILIIMNNKPVAIVTGGSSGIGRSICARLLAEHFSVINADINPPEESPASDYRYIRCDVTERNDVQVLSGCIPGTGIPEVLVLNAGKGIHEKLRDGDPEKWIDVINVN